MIETRLASPMDIAKEIWMPHGKSEAEVAASCAGAAAARVVGREAAPGLQD